jgi:hypothetical protein
MGLRVFRGCSVHFTITAGQVTQTSRTKNFSFNNFSMDKPGDSKSLRIDYVNVLEHHKFRGKRHFTAAFALPLYGVEARYGYWMVDSLQ